MATQDPQHTARLVRQHARTSQLLGVDFVPRFRTTADTIITAPPVVESAQKTHPVQSAPAKPAIKSPPAAAATHAVGTRTRESVQAALDTLRARYEADAPHKKFVTNFTNIVFGEGDPLARLCFIGEAPGEDEDLSGRPFVGRAGQLLDKMIGAMGLTRDQVYICNVLKTRPPGNRTPTPDEVAVCKPYLLEQLAIIQPEVAVALGLSATHALLNSTDSMARLRSTWHNFPDATGRMVPLMPTYHPAFLLRSYTDENRAKVWTDLKMVLSRLGMGPKA